MTDYLLAADDLRSLCQSADQVLTDAVRDAAVAYRDACQEVNARLRRCEEYLQKGLRSEAIHLAESDPPLLDALAALDFPERAQWEQITGMYGLAAAPKLRVETAEALNRAYAEEQPLQQYLRNHRRLNLSRAPLRDRLASLRQLQQVDSGNSVWNEDIRLFESARHRELSETVETAAAAGDFVSLGQCWDEVLGTQWLSAPPPKLVNRLRGSFLHHLADELQDAWRGKHVSRVRRLREQWDSLDPKGGLPADDPLWRRVNPALRWIAAEEERQVKQAEFQIVLSLLEQGLRANEPLEQLHNRWTAVREFDFVVPSDVEQKYYKRVEELRKDRDYRERMILVGTFSAGAIALVGFLVFIMLR